MVAIAALLAALTLGTDTTVARLRATNVTVDGDTVWFSESRPEMSEPRPTRMPMVGYVRRTGAWLLVERPVGGAPHGEARRVPRSGSFSGDGRIDARLPGGWTVADTTPQYDPRYVRRADAKEHVTDRHVLVAPGGERYELRIRITGTERRALYLRSGSSLKRNEAPPPFTTELSRWAAGEGRLAFAFPAPEPPRPDAPWRPLTPEEAAYDHFLSGFLVVDTATRKATPVLHPALLERRFRALEIAGGALWAVPERDDPDARDDSPRLARFDLASGAWRLFRAADVPLQDGDILALAADDERLYMAGRDGVAVLDARTLAWTARWYADSSYLLPDGADTVVTRLTTRRPAHPSLPLEERVADTASVLDAIADELGPRHRSAFRKTLLREVPFEELADLVTTVERQRGGKWDMGEAFVVPELAMPLLAKPAFVPFLREVFFASIAEVGDFAGDALRTVGEAEYRAALRAALDSAVKGRALRSADTLAGLGDSTGLRWLRARLRDTAWLRDTVGHASLAQRPIDDVAQTLARRQDTASVSRLVELMATSAPAAAPDAPLRLWWSVQPFRDRAVRVRFAAAAARVPLLWPSLLRHAADSLPLDDPAVRAALTDAAVGALTLDDDAWARVAPMLPADLASRADVARAAIRLARRLDTRRVVGALVASLGIPGMAYAQFERHQALVALTGRDDAPTDPRTDADRDAIRRFWEAWWRDHGATFAPVTEREGEAALARWARRHQGTRP